MSRLSFLNEISNDIKKYSSFLTETVHKLGWSEDGLLSSTHLSCEKDDESLEQTCEMTQNSLLGSDGASTSGENSLKLYNELLSSVPQASKVEKQKTWLEVLAAERDAKRRRTSYKNKIHTKHKSYNEVLKEVIEQQMGALGDWMSTESCHSHETNEQAAAPPLKNADMIEVRFPPGNPHTAWKILDREASSSQRENHSSKSKEPKMVEGNNESCKYSDKYRKRHKDDEFNQDTRRKRSLTPSHRGSKYHSSSSNSYRKKTYRSHTEESRYRKHLDSDSERLDDSKHRNIKKVKPSDKNELNMDNDMVYSDKYKIRLPDLETVTALNNSSKHRETFSQDQLQNRSSPKHKSKSSKKKHSSKKSHKKKKKSKKNKHKRSERELSFDSSSSSG